MLITMQIFLWFRNVSFVKEQFKEQRQLLEVLMVGQDKNVNAVSKLNIMKTIYETQNTVQSKINGFLNCHVTCV